MLYLMLILPHRTNLPKEVMAFPDFPFPLKPPSFITHQAVRQYLEDYIDKFAMRDYIKVSTTFSCLCPAATEDADVMLHCPGHTEIVYICIT